MSSPVGDAFHAQRCGRLATPRKTGTKKGAASVQPLSSLGQAEHHSNHCPLELKPVALSPRFLFFLDLLSPASAAAPLEQHPAEEDLLPVAPLVSAEAEAPLEQQLADLDLSPEATLPSVEAEAPLEQQLADLDLSQEAFWSLEQVCSVLALLSEGASVDWADAVNAKNAKAPRKRNLFIVLLSFIDRRKHQVGVLKPRYKLLQFLTRGEKGFHYFCPPATRRCARRCGQFLERWQSGNAAAC